MGRFGRLVRRLRGVVSRIDGRDVTDELQLHLDLLAEEYRADGLSDVDARARARRAFGNPTRLAEQTREVSTVPWIEGVLKDIAFGLRQLRRQPLVTTLAVMSLAIGIGANTAIFSVVSALLLKPLPYPDPDRLAVLWLRSPGINIPEDWPSPGQYIDVRTENRSFQEMSSRRSLRTRVCSMTHGVAPMASANGTENESVEAGGASST